MVPVSLVMVVCTLPGQSIIVSQFNTSFRDSLGISLVQLGAAYFIGTLGAAFPLRRIGRLSDTLGPRLTTALVTLGLLLGCLVVARSVNLATITLGFFLIRLFGQGAMGMLSSHILALWFERRLATVESIKHAGFSAATVVAPQSTFWLIAAAGWRNAYAIMGLSVCAIILPIVATFFRNKPEDIGQHLDNEPPREHERWHNIHEQHTQPDAPIRFTLAQTRASLTFWLIIIPGMISGLVGTAMIFHVQPILEHAGVTDFKEQGANALSVWGAALLVSTIISGPLADKLAPRLLIPIASALMAGSFVAMGVATTGVHAAISMALFGLSQGLYTSSFGPAIARYYGRPHHGEIRGFVTTLFVAGTASGPFLVAYGARLAGGNFTSPFSGTIDPGAPPPDFGPPFFASAAAALVAGLMATRATKPAPPQPQE